MSIAADTRPEADAVQVEAYRRMGGTGHASSRVRTRGSAVTGHMLAEAVRLR